MKFIVLFVFAYLTFAHAQQNIDKLNVNQLKLPRESVSRALLIDATGQVKASSSVTDTELSYLDGLNNTLVNLLNGKANDSDVLKLSGNQSASGIKTFTGKLVASSTVNGSTPCPVMTETQRNAFTPVQGDCVYNSTTLKLNVFDGSVWKDAGGAGGISLWLTANPYNINDIVIESDKIYRCLIAHTSGTFATDLAANRWVEVSSSPVTPYSLANGGTGKALTAVSGGIVWVDSDSFEVLSAGVSGQVLRSNGSLAPSWEARSVPGKSQYDTTQTVEEIQVPNNQLTQTALNRHLIESGNQNILSNPSFEHATFSTGWTTATGGTPAENTTNEVHGLKAYSINLSAALSVRQDSTLYASEFNGSVQGLASIRVKSSNVVTLCARQAGVTSTSLCVPSRGSNTWELLKVPFILSATSNGLNVSTTATSGTVLLDDAFVGAVDLKVDGVGSQISALVNLSSNQSLTSGVETTIQFNTKQRDTNNAFDTANFRFNVPESGEYQVAAFAYTNGTVSANLIGYRVDGGTTVTLGASNTNGVNGARTIFLSRGQLVDFRVTSTGTSLALQSNAFWTYASINRVSTSATYSSNNADTDWAPCQFSTLTWQGLGTVTNASLQCKRQGSDLLMRGYFTTGTLTGSVAQILLPTWNGVQLVAGNAGSSVIAGRMSRDNNNANFAKDYAIQIQSGSNFLTIGAQEYVLAVSPLGQLTGSSMTGGSFSIENIRIPIQGWENSNIIIGQFNGLESCQDSYSCTDTFSAKISSSGVVSDENLDFISGNCSVSGASIYTCTLVSGLRGGGQNLTSGMNCAVSPNADGVGTQFVSVNGSSMTTLTFATVFNSGTGNRPFSIVCQKAGADYMAKTAKAAASDQNTRTPGVTNSSVFSTYYHNGSNGACTGTCTVDQIGTEITSITRGSTGNYSMLLSRTYQKLRCLFNSQGGSYGTSGTYTCNNCNGLSFVSTNLSGGAQDSNGVIICHGNF